jgi:catechol 2,3-dioxygenase-like lactoylglutathione lyase family enzyme
MSDATIRETPAIAAMKSIGTAPGFHHVAIRAVDFDETIRFYTEALGFRVHHRFSIPDRIDRAAFLDAGDGRFVEVFGQGSTVQSEGRRRLPNEERTEGAVLHFCLRTADVEASYARAIAAGAQPRVPPGDTRRLGNDPLIEVKIAFITGPNGEVIEFLQSDQL